MEELIAFINPRDGTTFRCVKSQLHKNPGKDPWGSNLSPAQLKVAGQ